MAMLVHKNRLSVVLALLFLHGYCFGGQEKQGVGKKEGAATKSFSMGHLGKEESEIRRAVIKKYGYDLGRFEPIVKRILSVEAAHKNDIVMYHAQSSELKIIADFLNRLYAWKFRQPVPKDFYLLRYPPFGSKFTGAQDFLNAYGSRGFVYEFDLNPEIYSQLLSVNFSLFGNVYNVGEATLYYFLENVSVGVKGREGLQKLLAPIFAYEKLPANYIEYLVRLALKYATTEGTLYQIVLSTKAADRYAYLSQKSGIPVGALYVGKLYDASKKIIDVGYYNAQKKWYRRVSGVLNEYKKANSNPPDDLQGRLLLSKDFMLYPKSNVLMYRYTTVSAELEQQYFKELNELCAEIFSHVSYVQSIATRVRPITTALSSSSKKFQQESLMPAPVSELEEKEMKTFFAAEQIVWASKLINVIKSGGVESLKKMVEQNPELIAVIKKNQLAIVLEILKSGKLAMADYLIIHLKDAQAENVVDAPRLLMTACYRGELGLVRYLTELKSANKSFVDVNVVDEAGRTPFMYAVLYGHLPIVRYLSLLDDAGKPVVNFHARDNGESTALDLAAAGGQLAVVKYLVSRKNAAGNLLIDVNAQNKFGMTVLMRAAYGGKLDIVQYLLSLKDAQGKLLVDVNEKDNNGKTALDYALANGHPEIVELLRKVMKEQGPLMKSKL
jgi:ankyrin repeat protein